MDKAYLERVAQDLSQRASSLILNNQTVQLRSSKQDGSKVVVVTEPVSGITKVSSLKLLDEAGNLITERTANVDVLSDQSLEFRFVFEVRGAKE
ncbi:hypothetical protein O0555_24460 [Brevibacillus laterosporus]|uniref:hypothetical protein n=1 Tax=Brevibacillus laterosporus TaxID=1465 RepID=UPI0018CE2CF4|nr:hypothetical protein [Brevibacillus laterosporus]MBG9798451.1 hypothetical protein [Brevibacillus laterosporus]MCR8940424.1 hypothetical protein [Brevibacillus laterosporus]MCZ0843063.1 hypothetical protein [Brevibacillus laterosporus]MCZ0847659.1 hypothetical protein [Brevibacillus laterosporus]MED1913326.1 hypothetical protein [Brevibacillus laterosporus]